MVEDETPVRQMIVHYLASCGVETLQAADGDEAMEIFRREMPHVVLTDVVIPKMNGVELLRSIKAEEPNTAVIVMTGFGSDEQALQVLRAGAANYLRKPFQLADLGQVIKRSLAWFAEEETEVVSAPFGAKGQVSICLNNDPRQVSEVIRKLWSRARAILGDKWVMPFRASLEELILNGMEHGNLGIPFAEKSAALDSNTFDQLIAERSGDPILSKRRVRVEMTLTSKRVRCSVADDGDGFDWRTWIERPLDDVMLMANGRGISLARVHAHELAYNEKGNQVTLIWYVERLEENVFNEKE